MILLCLGPACNNNFLWDEFEIDIFVVKRENVFKVMFNQFVTPSTCLLAQHCKQGKLNLLPLIKLARLEHLLL